MGQSLTYATTEPVTPEVRKAVEAEAKRLNRERPWWCENLIFYKDRRRPKHLTGDTKLFLGLGDEILDDEDEDAAADVEFDDDQFMAFHDARFILLTLADWSRRYGVSWEVMMSGVDVGRVSGGRIDPPGLFQVDVSPEQLQADDEKARAIHAHYADRKG